MRRKNPNSMKHFRRFVRVFRKHFEQGLRSFDCPLLDNDGNLNGNFGSKRSIAIAADLCAFTAREIATYQTGYVITDADYHELRTHAYEASGLESLRTIYR